MGTITQPWAGGSVSELLFFKSPPISSEAMVRLLKAAHSSPPFSFGESNSEAVRALQTGLIALYDPLIKMPGGPSGNYLKETQTAVKAFQRKFSLHVDGAAGQETIHRLDQELDRRSARVLENLDRCVDGCLSSWASDKTQREVVDQMQKDLHMVRSTNSLGLAVVLAGEAILLVIIVCSIMMLWQSPQERKGLATLMKQIIEAFSARGEVLHQKIDELKEKIREFLRSATDLRGDCEREKEKNDPRKWEECKRLHRLAVEAARSKLWGVLARAGAAIGEADQGQTFDRRGLKKLFGREVYVALGDALKEYLNALNDFFKCLGCPEIPLPFFPDFPHFP